MIKIKNIIALVILLFALSSCDGQDTWCYSSGEDSYSDTSTIESVQNNYVNIDGNSQNANGELGVWVDSGVFLTGGATIQVSVGPAPGNEITIASGYNSDSTNDSLNGEQYVILASNGSPTAVVDSTGAAVQFAPQQQITITTNACTTGPDSYGTKAPTKWTWSNNWIYQGINCSFVNWGCGLTYTCPSYPSKPDCVAAADCAYDCVNMGALGKWCTYNTITWYCHHKDFEANPPPYESSQANYETYDVCPPAPAPNTAPAVTSYVCEGQTADTYAPLNPPYNSQGQPYDSSQGNAGYCDGKRTNSGSDVTADAWSNSHPNINSGTSHGDSTCGAGSNQDDDLQNDNSNVSYNETGSTDSCWNTGGYRMYGIQNGVQCPEYDSDGNLIDDQCEDLADSTGGKSFSALGGPLWLQIIDPNSSQATDPEDVSDYHDDINTNTTTINSLDDENTNTLYPQLTDQLNTLLDYYTNGTIDGLISQGNSLIQGLTDPNLISQMNNIINYLGHSYETTSTTTSSSNDPDGTTTTYYNSSGYSTTTTITVSGGTATTTITTTITGLEGFFSDLETILTSSNSSYDPSDSSTWEPTVVPYGFNSGDPTSWTPTTYPAPPTTNIYDQAGTVITAAQALDTTTTLTGTTTTQDIIDYQNTILNTLNYASGSATVQGAIYDAENTQSQIDANNAQIASLNSENDVYYNDIYESNQSANNNKLVGGYTVSVEAGPLVADNGQYLAVLLVQNGQDPNNASSTDYQYWPPQSSSNGYTIQIDQNVMQYTVPESGGEIWMRINDPDNNYSNNAGYYTVNYGQVSYTSGFSTLLSELIAIIQSAVNSAAQKIFEGVTCSSSSSTINVDTPDQSWCTDYYTSVSAILYLYVIIFGMMYIFGLIRSNHVDFVMRIVKFATVSVLLRPDSFDFFNTYLYQGFYGLTNTLVSAATGAPLDNPFDFISQSVNVLLLDQTTYFKIIGLLFQGVLGICAFVLLIYGCIAFTISFFRAFIVYMSSFIGLGICFALGPIYIVFLLFDKTSYLFELWFKAMVRLSIIPVILLVGLIFLNGMLSTILVQLFNYEVCYKCTMPFTFSLPGYPQVGTTTLFCVSWFSKWGLDNVDSVATTVVMSFPFSISFCMIAQTMMIYSERLAIQVATAIVGSSSLFKEGTKAMGLNPYSDLKGGIKYMDKKVERVAIRTGVARNSEEYKKMRNRSVRKGAKMSAIVGLGPGAVMVATGRKLYNMHKKKSSGNPNAPKPK